MKRKLMIFLALILLMSVGAVPALAQGSGNGKVVFGSNVVLGESDFVDGDVVVFGGNLIAENGSKVDGDVVVFGGTASVNGKVEGDVVVIGGTVSVDGEVDGDVAVLGGAATIGPNAHIDGDVATAGGSATIDPAASVGGSVVDGPGSVTAPEVIPATPAIPATPVAPVPPVVNPPITRHSGPTFGERMLGIFSDGVSDIVLAAVLAGLAALVVMFFPTYVKTAERAIKDTPAPTAGIGLASIATAAVAAVILALTVFLCIGVLLFPAFIIILLAAALLGTAALGKVVGDYIFDRFTLREPTPVAATLLGVGLIALLGRMPFVDHLPWVGWVFGLAGFFIHVGVLSMALGSAVLTRFGTQAYAAGSQIFPSSRPVRPVGYPVVPSTPPAPPEDAPPSTNDTIDALDDLIHGDDEPEDDTPPAKPKPDVE